MSASADDSATFPAASRLPPHLNAAEPHELKTSAPSSSASLLGSLPSYHQPFSPFRPAAQTLLASQPMFSATYGTNPSPFTLSSATGVIKSGVMPTLSYNRPIVRPERQEATSSVSGPTVQQASVLASNHVSSLHTTNANASDSCTASQKLKVEDALSYLDQVKVQFCNRPQVYSDFLDIMKDFKSQSIDTPGVIQRVSSLFRGRPNLIVGFNTFLPPGYKIEVDGERISICTPNGDSRVISDGSTTSPEKSALSPTANNTDAAKATTADGQPQVGARPAIEFNHAISYVNKIKNRFHHNPDVYKQFLEILHSYQKEQRDLKLGSLAHKPVLTESEVYQSVAKLFENEPDLLREFSQFLPDATGPGFLSSFQNHLNGKSQTPAPEVVKEPKEEPKEEPVRAVTPPPVPHTATVALKRHASSPRHDDRPPPPKKIRRPELKYDVEFSEAAKCGTIEEFQFFDKVRKAFKSDDVYDNFLRCLVLFNQDLISKTELIDLLIPFLGKFPDLMRWLKTFMGCNDRSAFVESLPVKVEEREHISSDLAMEIDYASCKRQAVSYRALPASYQQPYCGGQDALCRQVLNTTWVSFPSWSSEDSSFVSSKKTQYEEFIYRTEDERFELDIVIDTNASAMQTLEASRRKMARMSSDDAKRHRLDETMGGGSGVHMLRAIKRIYGDKAGDIIDGLKRNPAVAVPLVLKRLKAKDAEWREAQKGFNRIWREQNEKYHLKSLDHQGITFKQNDLKQLRSKVILNQIETLYDERREKIEEGTDTELLNGPHIEFKYPEERNVLYDVADLLIHHVRRQTSIQKEEKSRIKRMLKQVLPDLFGLEKEPMSDDEDQASPPASQEKGDAENGEKEGTMTLRRSVRTVNEDKQPVVNVADWKQREEPTLSCGYALFFAPNAWYVFLRLHQVTCERLSQLKEHARNIETDRLTEKKNKNAEPSAAESLKLNQKDNVPPSQYYAHLIAAIKNLLDGQLDSCQYEDQLRQMFTIKAYVAFTMDKLVQTMVRQLQHMVTEPMSAQSSSLHHQYRSTGGAGGYVFASAARQEQEQLYQSQAEQLMTDHNCFKIYFLHESGRVTFELLDTDSAEPEEDKSEWSTYIQAFLELTPEVDGTNKETEPLLSALNHKPIYLVRNTRHRKRILNSDGQCSSECSTEACTSDCLIKEDLHVQLKNRKTKISYVANTNDVYYRRGAPGKAKKSHPEVQEKRQLRFKRWCGRHQNGGEQLVKWLAGQGEWRSQRESKHLSAQFEYLKFNVWRTRRR